MDTLLTGVEVGGDTVSGFLWTATGSLRLALAAVGAVNLETKDRVELAFFGFSSVLSAEEEEEAGAVTFLVNKATLGTRAGLGFVRAAGFLGSSGVVITGFLTSVVGFLRPSGLLLRTGSFFLSCSGIVLRNVVCCLLIGALGLSSLLLLTEETLFAVFFTTSCNGFFSSVLLALLWSS